MCVIFNQYLGIMSKVIPHNRDSKYLLDNMLGSLLPLVMQQ